MTALRGLPWKDVRLARAYLICGAVVAVTPHGFLAYARFRCGSAPDYETGWPQTLFFTALIQGLAAMIVIALLAGAAFATERTDRSVEFLAYLPISRGQRLLSKLSIAACAIVTLTVANPLLIYSLAPGFTPGVQGKWGTLATLACSGVAIFGTAWLSSMRVSSASALLLGLLSPAGITAGYFAGVEALNGLFAMHVSRDDWFPISYRCACLALGVLSWSLGTWLFIKRGDA